jgi:hypothetical protein
MTEYLCLTLLAHPAESEAAFKSRLTAFWTHMLRNRPDDYEKVFAEASHFGIEGGRVSRQYLVEADVIEAVAAELAAHDIPHAEVDRDDTYSKYEAATPDWFQIEH